MPRLRPGSGKKKSDGRIPRVDSGGVDKAKNRKPKKVVSDQAKKSKEMVDLLNDLATSGRDARSEGGIKAYFEKKTNRKGRINTLDALQKQLESLNVDPPRRLRTRNKEELQELEEEFPGILDLKNAISVLSQLVNNDQASSSGGAGALGFTKEFLSGPDIQEEKPAKITSYIRDTLLNDDTTSPNAVKQLKEAYKNARDNGVGNEATTRANVQKLIKKMEYEDMTPNERHAIGPGTDVVAMSIDPDGNMTGASPYSEITGSVDALAGQHGWTKQDIAEQIAYYAKLSPNGLTPKKLPRPKRMSDAEYAKLTFPLREFATIMLAEKGRELKRMDEKLHNEGMTEDKKLVEKAIAKSATEGFREIFATKKAKTEAVFAQKGGQKALKKAYGGIF